ncbi:MAG: hypothetical protein E5V63_18405 [Mesorhizobium sp.]|nr:MAG: hypothetical protein E5V63_18405 [Mesorhizobium sp.]
MSDDPEPLTAGDARARSLACARRINVCLEAREYNEARHQLAEAKRFALLALKFEQEQAA